jgi:hypothetical protein
LYIVNNHSTKIIMPMFIHIFSLAKITKLAIIAL